MKEYENENETETILKNKTSNKTPLIKTQPIKSNENHDSSGSEDDDDDNQEGIIHIQNTSPEEKPKKKKIDYSDILLLNDLDLFFKNGKYPFMFFSHLLSTLLITFLLMTQISNLNKLMQQTRAVQSAFYFNEDTSTPTVEYPRKYFYTQLDTFSEALTNLINIIYDINKTIDFNIYFENINELQIYIKYKTNAIEFSEKNNYSLPYNFSIKEKDIDPIKEYYNEDNEKLKEFFSKTKKLVIPLKYKYNNLDYGACQMVNLNLDFDTSKVSYIKFGHVFEFENCDFNQTAFFTGFIESYSIFSLLLAFVAIAEVIIVLLRIVKIIKIVMFLKDNLSKVDFFDGLSNEQLYLRAGESKWDLINNKDIFNLFPKWLIIFVLAGIFNIMGGIYFIFEHFFNGLNQILFGFGSFFSWIAFAYYFHSNKKYNVFYQTLYKSAKEYKYLFITFVILFSGFCLLNLSVHSHCDEYYGGFQGTFVTVFAATLGDILIDIWSSTFDKKPIITLILGFIMFIIFLGIHIRVMFTVAQESYSLANLETQKSWLDHALDFGDYLKQQFNMKKYGERQNGNKHKDDFAIDDAWMRAVFELDDMNKLESLDLNNLKAKGLNSEAVVKYLKRIIKEKRQKKLSKEIYEEILTEEPGNTEMDKLNGKNKKIERVFNHMEKMFRKMYIDSASGFNQMRKEQVKEICQQSLEEIDKIKRTFSN